MTTLRQLARDIGTVVVVSIVAPPRSSSARIISDVGQTWANVMRYSLDDDTRYAAERMLATPAAPVRRPFTIDGIRETLYDTHRRRWIETGDLTELEQMVRHVR